jgi:hypothetical protein
MPIKSFRGLIDDSEQQTISLHTNNGSTGYRIVKFELMAPDGNQTIEVVAKVFSVTQTAITDDIDFSDQTLLACGIWKSTTSANNVSGQEIVFDNVTFNQDIYVTAARGAGSGKINYHIELEQVKLDLNENTVATLKDIRNLA